MIKTSQSKVVQCEICDKFIYIPNKNMCCGVKYIHLDMHEVQKESTVDNFSEKKTVNKRRRRKKRKNLCRDLRIRVLKRDRFRCTECNSKMNIHVHHINPRSKGGTDSMENLQTLCDLCHAEKHRGEPIYDVMVKSIFIYQEIV